MKSFKFLIGLIAALLLVSCDQKKEIPDAEITAIAKEAYIYGYPMVKNYKDMYVSAIDVQNPNYKKPFNEFYMSTRINTPADNEKETARNDTPYGSVWLDLRREPLVMTVPAIEDNRYYSVQFTDLYAYNFDYVGTRTSGNSGGKFLIAGPDWKGDVPAGINRVIRADTQFVHGLVRIQLLNPGDLENVQKIQEGFALEPLSLYAGMTPPAEVSPVQFPAYSDEKVLTPEFFSYMNFVMQFASIPPDEAELMGRFEKISVGPGKSFSVEGMPENEKKAYQAGIDGAIADLDGALKGDLIRSADMHGTRTELKNNYLNRAYGAMTDMFGASPQEILSISYKLDSGFKILNGSNYYTIRFEKDQLPPTDAFWSLTIYRLPDQLLVENPIQRYHINSNMVSQMVTDPVDGSVTIFIQKDLLGSESSASAQEANKVSDNKTEANVQAPTVPAKDTENKVALAISKDVNAVAKKDANSATKPVVAVAKPVATSEKKDVAKDNKPVANKQMTGKPAGNNQTAAKLDSSASQEKQNAPADIQNQSQLSANWLPAPDSDFYMVLRIYIPKDEVLNGTWKEPVVVRFNADGTPAENSNETGDAKPAEEKPVETTQTSTEKPDGAVKTDGSGVTNAATLVQPEKNTPSGMTATSVDANKPSVSADAADPAKKPDGKLPSNTSATPSSVSPQVAIPVVPKETAPKNMAASPVQTPSQVKKP